MMFIVPCPSCGRCGCECGRLPYTVTATLSDLAQRNRTAECSLTLTSCFGSGAKAVVTQPGGCTNTPTCGCIGSDAGPITEVLITDGGSCYAVLGREEPVVTATAISDSGAGAEFLVTLDEGQDQCGLPVWSVTKVEVLEKGIGYEGVPSIVFSAVDGSREVESALGYVSQMEAVGPPSLTVLSAVGSGAKFVANITQSGFTPDRWSISSVAVTAGGEGYFDGALLSVDDYEGLFVVDPAQLVLRTARAAPTLQAFPMSGGLGASIAITTAQTGSDPDLWSAAAISISDPGSGYVNGDLWTIYATDGIAVADGTAVATVNEEGGLLSLLIADGGQFYVDTGVAESVDVADGGSYYEGGGGIEEITITLGGEYYRENPSLPALTADVTVTPCGGGAGATITAAVDDDVDSETFGQVIALDITSGGDGYLSWTWDGGCLDRLNEESIVLRAQNPHVLVTLEVQSCYGTGACIDVKTTVGTCGEAGSPLPLPAFPRAAPRLSLSATPGIGACITPKFEFKSDACGFPYWYIESVSAFGGTNYNDVSQVQVDILAGVQEEAANLTLYATNGVATSVTVADGGKFYQQCDYTGGVTALPGVTLTSGGEGYAKRGRVEPTLALKVPDSAGFGVTLTHTLGKNVDDCGLDYWYISEVSTAGGSGYEDSSNVNVVVVAGVSEEPAIITLISSDGVPSSVSVARGGKYYLESNAVAAYTPDIKVAVVQLAPSAGAGAVVSVTVETDPTSFNFGKITDATLTTGGGGYLLFGGPKDCKYEGACNASLDFSGRSVVGLLTGVFHESQPQPDCSDLSSETTIERGLVAGTVNVTPGGVFSSCAQTDCGECASQCACGRIVTVTIDLCGETIEFSMPVEGGYYIDQITLEVPPAIPPEQQEGAGYIEISASSGCQTDGCGYQVAVLICYACRRESEDDPVNPFGEAFRGCVAADEVDGCPVDGAVEMTCLNILLGAPIGCAAEVTAVVS